MPSLRQLLAAHAPLLLIDAASTRIQVGVLEAGTVSGRPYSERWETSDDEAGVGVFRCLEILGVKIAEVGAFVFCEGPGSMLGVRTVAMALRTWQVIAPKPAFAFQSLAVVAHALGRNEALVIADARRDSWHVFSVGDPKLRRIPTSELNGDLVMPEPFRHWSELPGGVTRVPYSLAELLPRVADKDLFHATDAPDAFLHEEPSYVTWTPHIHRAR